MTVDVAMNWNGCPEQEPLEAIEAIDTLKNEVIRLQGVEDCVTTLRIRNAALKLKVGNLESDLIRSDREHIKLNSEIERLKDENAVWIESIKNFANTKDLLLQQVEVLEAEVERLKAEVWRNESFRKKIDALEEELSLVDKRAEAAESKVHELSKEAAGSWDAYLSVKAERDRYRVELENMEERYFNEKITREFAEQAHHTACHEIDQLLYGKEQAILRAETAEQERDRYRTVIDCVRQSKDCDNYWTLKNLANEAIKEQS
jgi:chromosome segregation ATPase